MLSRRGLLKAVAGVTMSLGMRAQMRAESALMERWYKQADPVFDDNGRLTIWRPAA